MKLTYSDADLDGDSFHDNHVHGHLVVPELAQVRFDLDWIARWVPPSGGSPYFSFMVSPATLVFEHASDLELVKPYPDIDFIIFELLRVEVEPRDRGTSGRWQYELQGVADDAFLLRASGYRLHLRAEPVLVTEADHLTIAQRGGVSFDVPLAVQS